MSRRQAGSIRVSVCDTVEIDTEVDVSVEDIIDSLDFADEAALAKLRAACGLDRAPTGARLDHVVERAYAAARQMANLPREIADLFWHVHGRAI